MSLATRITLLVTALLGVCGVAAGAALHRAARRSLEAEIQGRLDARLAWLNAALDVELEDGELQLDAPDDPAGSDAAPHWQVATTDGRVLWASAAAAPAEPISRSATVTFGAADAPPVPPHRIAAGDESRDAGADGAGDGAGDGAAGGGARGRSGWAAVPPEQLPPAAAHAARLAVPDLRLLHAYRKTRGKKRDAAGEAALEVRGTARGREYALRLDAAGNVLRVKDNPIDPFAAYVLPPDAARVDLVLTAQASGAEARDELARLGRTLWSLGPLALAATAAVLALLVRWQLRPLARMAEQASRIGPATLRPAGGSGAGGEAVDAAGGGAELARLRAAINRMVARLGEGLERERRFAADAAHELRSPLAEMRATVEVALRRPREAPEYRQALEAVASDLLRLQNLVTGLLQLTRADAGGVPGRPVALAPLLRRAAAQCRAAGGRADAAARGADAADGVWVLGDEELLHAAVCNVLANAARYAPPEPPTVTVESDAENGVVRVVICDRGPGVAAGDRERIFQPLTRLDGARTAAGADGFGLGLAVARGTARAFGGDLACTDRPDGAGGAAFVFTLRRADPPDAEAAPAEDAPSGPAR